MSEWVGGKLDKRTAYAYYDGDFYSIKRRYVFLVVPAAKSLVGSRSRLGKMFICLEERERGTNLSIDTRIIDYVCGKL